jgi:hypothetical protein
VRLIIALLLWSTYGKADDTGVAMQVAAQALVKQTGLDKKIEEVVKENVPKEVQEWVGRISIPMKAIADQRIEISFEF